jgi:malate dehydrogenase (oxaloacetate-decarboxylating)(NADP+)
VKIVASGAGAAALACLNLLVSLGARARTSGSPTSRASSTRAANADGPLEVGLRAEDRQAHAGEVIDGADIFLGLSAPGVLKPRWSSGWRTSR